MLPPSTPRLNQLTRCALVPCVNDSGTTVPCDLRCRVSSPIWAAALSAASMSPGSRRQPCSFCERAAQTPAKQSACSSTRTLTALACASPPRPPQRLDLVHDAELVLDVVADLVGDHVGLRELSRRAELLLEHLVEAQVDVDLLVVGAVERSHRRLALAACRRPAAAEEHQLGRLVGPARLLEDIGPDTFRAAQHLRDEARPGIVGRWLGRRTLLLDGRGAAAALHHAEQGERVDAEDPAGDDRDRDAADAQAAPADAEPAAAAATHAANVLDVAAFVLPVHAHVDLPGVKSLRS